jgi:membrane protein required for colicin V production
MLSILDFIIIGVIAFSALVSIFRGFVRELLSIVTWVISFWVAWHFGQVLAALLAPYVHNQVLRYPVAFIALFVITMILGSLLNYLIGQLVDKTGLSGTDRVLGLLFGLLRGALIVGVMLLVLRLTPAPQQAWWHDARLLPVFMPIEVWLQDFLPKDQQPNFFIRKE